MQKKLICTLFIFSILPLLAAANPQKARTLLPTNSVAMSDDALATFFNPAGLGTNRALNLYYLRTYQSDFLADDAFFIAAPGTGFSMEFVNAADEIDFARYSLSAGQHLGKALYWGTSYSWINADDKIYNQYKSLSVGLMYRRRYFSIGAIGRDLNRPKLFDQKLGRTYDIGLAIRPGTWRTTFSVDMRKTQKIREIDISYGVEIRPIRELVLRGTYNSNGSFDVRFGINLANFGIGTANYFDEHRKTSAGVGYFHFSNASITKPVPRKRLFLDLGMNKLGTVLRIAKWDKDVVGALIRIDGSKYGMGQIQEVRDAIIEFKESDRAVICYITNCSTGDYIVASACDVILMHPSAEVRLIGIRSERSYYKGALDKLGIRANLEHIGEYKSASESFTRDNMSEPHRENQIEILDDLYDQLTSHIATARGWTPEEVKQLIDQGPFTANAALKSKVVDELIYEDRLMDMATELTGSKVSFVNISAYINSGLAPHSWEVPKPKIAIIHAEGTMLTGESFFDPLTGMTMMGSDTIARAIKRTREDKSIKAVVLRIDSGGGLVIAADIIWHELIRLKKEKPLVVSMADVAASGGYYIAAPADVIVAEPGTITGSIGVISGKYSFKELYQKIGIKKEIITRGANADFYSDYTDYPPKEQKIVLKQINEIYDNFITKVASGRTQLTKEDVDKVGRGRVWTGRQAKENGLVDELGGLDLALAIAQKRAGLQKKSVEIVRLPKQNWMSRLLGKIVPIANGKIYKEPTIYNFLGQQLIDQNAALKLLNLIKKHRVFLLMPYEIYLAY